MTKFEIGKTYSMRSICDHECVWMYEVVARTDTTVTLKDITSDSIKRCRISKQFSEMDGRETVKPLGTYSMCPMLRA